MTSTPKRTILGARFSLRPGWVYLAACICYASNQIVHKTSSRTIIITDSACLVFFMTLRLLNWHSRFLCWLLQYTNLEFCKNLVNALCQTLIQLQDQIGIEWQMPKSQVRQCQFSSHPQKIPARLSYDFKESFLCWKLFYEVGYQPEFVRMQCLILSNSYNIHFYVSLFWNAFDAPDWWWNSLILTLNSGDGRCDLYRGGIP